MRRLGLLTIIMTAACISPDLVPCGDQSCPAGTVCVGGTQCAHPDQLAACEGLVDGTACHSAEGDGRCANSSCVLSVCGDRIVEPGEVCDDGNVVSGDGCSGDCRSNETCGNGILDLGEHCDCGSDATSQPPGCPTPNSTDPSAICDPSCSRYCGDGVITGTEQCDGTSYALSCANVGYYTGAPTCTPFCTLDFSSCAERCGDGVVQTIQGEVCDGAPPPGTCIDYGRDYGVVGCSTFCAPDLAGTCYRYGYRQLSDAHVYLLAANAHGFVGLDGNASLAYLLWDGTESSHANSDWALVDATDSLVVGAGPTTIGWYDGSWHDLAIGVGSAVAIATLGTTLYSIDATCALTSTELTTGAQTALASAPASACNGILAAGDGNLYIAANDDGLLRGDGTSWTVADAGATSSVTPGRTGQIVLGGSDGIDTFELATSIRAPSNYQNPHSFAVDRDGVGLDVNFSVGEQELTFTTVFASGFAKQIPPPVNGATSAIASRDGWVLLFGYDSGVYRLEPVAFDVTGFGDPHTQVSLLADGTLVACGDSIGWVAGDGSSASWPAPSGGCSAVLGDPRGVHLVANANGVWRYDPVASQYSQDLATGTATSLAGSLADSWTVIGGQPPMELVAGTWTPQPFPDNCDPTLWPYEANLVAGTSTIYALTDCDNSSAVLRWDGGGWTLLAEDGRPDDTAPETVTQLLVLPDGTPYIFAVNYEMGSAIYQVGASGLTALLYGPQGLGGGMLLAGVSSSDYVYTFGDGAVIDGTTSSPINLPAGQLALTPQYLYSYSANTQTLHVVTRMLSRTTGRGI